MAWLPVRFLAGTTGIMLLLAAQGGAALNLDFLEQAPMRYFQGNDLKLMSDNIDAVLAQDTRNTPSTWNNDATGSGGSAQVLSDFKSKDMDCRRIRISNRAGGRQEANTDVDFCLYGGEWKVLRLP